MVSKLKQTLKEKCSECGTKLELRSVEQTYLRKGEEVYFSTDKRFCPNCMEYIGDDNKKNSRPWTHWKPSEE